MPKRLEKYSCGSHVPTFRDCQEKYEKSARLRSFFVCMIDVFLQDFLRSIADFGEIS